MATRKTSIDGLGPRSSSATKPVKTTARPSKEERQAAVVAANRPKQTNTQVAVPTKSEKPSLTNPAVPAVEPAQSTESAKPAKSRKIIWILLGVVVALLLISVVYLLLRSAA